ncbi:MIP family channel protein [Winogradskyella sp.]|nr:MIP family channel protein [Winogradskyella sp.]MDB9781493.1 MIP family channel protein [Winogradskyella sp.]MDC1504257.1 MIP family channel protein [Winogradskyella sp.]
MSKKAFAELLGTFIMVFCGCGAMTVNEITGGAITHVGVAITWGLVVMAMIYAFGHISGAHLNPAVTIGFAVAKKFKWKDVPLYLTAQTMGAFLAILVLWLLFPESSSFGHTYPAEGFAPYKAFIFELFLTFFLMLVILNVSIGSKEIGSMAAIAVGGVILLEAMFAGPMTKASMNPARSLAPAFVSGNLEHLWLYLTAPIIGAILAVFCHKTIQ